MLPKATENVSMGFELGGNTLGRLSNEHLAALEWFQIHIGEIFFDTKWFSGEEIQQRLANKAKGIFKPKGWAYALSIRKSDDGPYQDGTINYRADGSWSFSYDAEVGGDSVFTNKALIRNVADGVPVGVYMKTKPTKNSKEYEIGGLGIPTEFRNGQFLIEGPCELEKRDGSGVVDLTLDGAKKRVVREIVQRQGQGVFRKRLLEVYSFRCAVTQYDVESAVEAAHIRPYSGPFSNDLANGILLRADIHTLFDLRQVGIHPDSLKFVVGNDIKGSRYAPLDGITVSTPRDAAFRPRRDFLQYAWEEFEVSHC